MLFEITPILREQSQSSAPAASNLSVSGAHESFEGALAATSASAASQISDASASAAAALEAQDTESSSEISSASLSSSRVDRSAADMSYSDSDFSVGDFVDVLNPLQHIPVIGTIYRAVTGDTIKPAERVAGDLLYGSALGSALVGAVTSLASVHYEQSTGEEPSVALADALFGSGSEDGARVSVASALPASSNAGGISTKVAGKYAVAAAAGVADPSSPAASSSASVTGASPQGAASSSLSAGAGSVPLVVASKGDPSSKQAFGGVMDPTAFSKSGGQSIAQSTLALASSKQRMDRIGGTLHPLSPLNRIARFQGTPEAKTEQASSSSPAAADSSAQGREDKMASASVQKVQAAVRTLSAKGGASASQLSSAQEAALAATGKGLAGTSSSLAALPEDSSGDKKLGDLFQKSVTAKESGSSLPPALVQDMMLMALDKYKTAGNYAPSEMALP